MCVGLRDGLVQIILLAGDLGYGSPNDAVAIYNGDNEDTIREKWGKEDFIRNDNPSKRRYVYRRYNLAIGLENNRADAIVVFNPQYYYKDASVPPERKRVLRQGWHSDELSAPQAQSSSNATSEISAFPSRSCSGAVADVNRHASARSPHVCLGNRLSYADR